MKKIIAIACMAWMALTGIYAGNISVEDVQMQAGETKTVSISLTNTETNLVGFQIDLTLPEGISINKAGCSLGSRIVDPDQVLTIGKQGDNVYRLTSTSLALTPISGTSGTLLTLSLTAANDSRGGTATLSNIRFATSNSGRVTMSDTSFNIIRKTEQTLALESLPEMTYGDAAYTLPATTEEGLTLTWTSDNAAVASISGNTLSFGNAGTATITATQAGNDSYLPFSREFSLTVGKAALTITANDCSKMEGEENPELTVSYEGFKNGDTEAVLTRQPTVTTQATTASPAGSYPITVSGAAAANYDINYVAGTLTVMEKATQTLALESLPAMIYGDATYTLPETTEEGFTLTWTSSNSAVALLSGNVLTVKGAGTATITAAQAGNGDYKAFSREFSLAVGKAALTITANDCTKVEGEENPELTVSYEGFVNDDDASVLTQQPVVTTEATTASPAGSYPITVSGAAAANYDISYVAGTLTVEEAPLEPTDISQMDNAIYVEKAEGAKGNSGTIVISLKNAQAATAYQFNLKLPEGVTLKTNNEGEYTCTLSSRHRGHNANINTLEDEGVYRIVVSSMQSKMIDGNDGNVLAIAVDVSDDLELGSYPIFIQDARYSLSGGTVIRMQETVGVFDIEDFLLGDVNEDGDIDVGDVVCIVNNSIGKPNEKFVEKAADVDYDGEIDIADAVKLVNFIIKKITVLSHHGIDNTTIDLPEPQ